jgi:hypothetical protein
MTCQPKVPKSRPVLLSRQAWTVAGSRWALGGALEGDGDLALCVAHRPSTPVFRGLYTTEMAGACQACWLFVYWRIQQWRLQLPLSALAKGLGVLRADNAAAQPRLNVVSRGAAHLSGLVGIAL